MKVKRIVTNIETQDISKARHFYEEILGLDQLMNHGFIATYGSHEKMDTQISFLSEGGSGTPAPDLSIEVDDLNEVLTRVKEAEIPIEYGPVEELGSSALLCKRPIRKACQYSFPPVNK